MIIAPELAGRPGLVHGFFTRAGGVSAGVYDSLNVGFGSDDDRAAILENRRRVCARLGVGADALAIPYQHHSSDALVVSEPWGHVPGPKADAVVTDRPGVAVGVISADCGPILFADPGAGVVAAAHAGWKGALGGIVEATIEAMERLGAARAAIVAVLGPCISAAAYEVGDDFRARFLAADAANARFFTAAGRAGHAMFDLPGFILARLAAAGVGQATALGLCTYSDPTRFFSYRRATHRGEADYGRLVAAIALTDRS
jgi:YfiH family protein